MVIGGDCAPTDPVDPGSGTPDLSSFHFTEVVSNNLPASITGYVEATCDGRYKYEPPAGYKVDSCTPALWALMAVALTASCLW